MDYKIVASDLDGTLLNSNSELSVENAEAIRLLTERGVVFVPATGRSYAEIPTPLKESPYIRYYIHSGGAVIYDKMTNTRTLFCLSGEKSRAIFEAIFRQDCHVTVRMNGNIYSDKLLSDDRALDYYNVWGVHRDILFAQNGFVDNFRDAVMNAESVEQISLFFHDDNDRQPIIDEVGKLGGVNFAKACPFNLEITSSTADKGNSLLVLAKSLGVQREATIGLGDSENDRSMVEAAGLGLAASNSMPSVLAIADGVMCSNDEHVAKYVLEKYF